MLLDLPGPKLRLGELTRPLAVRTGQLIELGTGSGGRLPVNFPELLPHLRAGESVLDGDGAVALRVIQAVPPTLTLEVLNDGTIDSRKGVNLPDSQLPIGAVSPNQRVVNQLALSWGVCPLLGTRSATFEEIVVEACYLVVEGGYGRAGDVIVITAGVQANQAGKTNMVKAHVVE